MLMALLVVPLVAGCSVLGLPPADAALDALPVAGVEGDGVPTPGPEASPTFFSSNDGYALTLPAGWVGVRTRGSATDDAFDALSGVDVVLADEARAILEATGARMSMIGARATPMEPESVPPGIAILVMSANGETDEETQDRLAEVINGVSTVDGEIEHSVISVAAGDADEYLLTVQGDELAVRLKVYLFTVGDDGVVILLGADPSVFDGARSDMDAIIKSLRFGV
jgi:hypothetical protein